ncbi:MAG: hypothetical protein NTW74_09300, partial [Acidobacteria bacterium]|nr:hypothetical protein [Acidobacteriota bacterium]
TVVPNAKGVGALYEFKTGGSVLIRPGAVAPGLYEIDGNYMVMPALQAGGPLNRQMIDLSQPGKLRLMQGKDVSMDLTRVGKAPAWKPTVIGEWVGMKLMEGQNLEMRIFFYPGGKSLFLLPFQTQQAKYSVTGDLMRITFPDGTLAEGPYKSVGTSLSVPSVRSGATTKLAKY